MSNKPQFRRGIVTRHTHPRRSFVKRVYVAVLLVLLPLLMSLFSALSKRAKNETRYLRSGFTLKIAITGWNRTKTVRCSSKSWISDRPTLIIGFRDLDYAFDVFSGTITLQMADCVISQHIGPTTKALQLLIYSTSS